MDWEAPLCTTMPSKDTCAFRATKRQLTWPAGEARGLLQKARIYEMTFVLDTYDSRREIFFVSYGILQIER